jgi:hypothetical protein
MIGILGSRLGLSLAPRRFNLEGGVRVEVEVGVEVEVEVEVDGTKEHCTVLVEAWARRGKPKSAQKHKVLADALRLLIVANTLREAPRLILCLSDAVAAHHFTTAGSWAAVALRAFGIEVQVVELPDDLRASVVRLRSTSTADAIQTTTTATAAFSRAVRVAWHPSNNPIHNSSSTSLVAVLCRLSYV